MMAFVNLQIQTRERLETPTKTGNIYTSVTSVSVTGPKHRFALRRAEFIPSFRVYQSCTLA